MNELVSIISLAAVILAIGLWLLLPRGASPGRALGAVLAAIGLGLFASRIPAVGSWAANFVFYILAGVTVLAALATISFRKPVYSAIWFGLSLVGTAGLLLFNGAQFLGVATIVVYAGAILVTFLFVLMLAQPEGEAPYDQLSWAPKLAALTGALVIGVLTLTTVVVFENPTVDQRPHAPFTTAELGKDVLSGEHMAHLGAQLFGKHLAAIEIAGTLLLVALVGAVAIVSQIRRPPHGGPSDG
ncbi:MAG: NADH-quinone oxidoreductase subunit J [Pirellulales bacterium]